MLIVKKLRCEYRENPIGFDVVKPRISWQIEEEEKNVLQTAFRIKVSKNKNFTNVVWDSGIVKSNESIHVEYDGITLEPCTRYYYKVRVWDNKDNESRWSEVSYFETGLMNTENWQGEWITPITNEKIDCALLRTIINVKKKVKSARVYATAMGLYEVYINGERISDDIFTPGWTNYRKRLQYQTYDVTKIIKKGTNAIGAVLGQGWCVGTLGWEQEHKFNSRMALLFQLKVSYDDGSEDIFISDNTWKSSIGPIISSQIYHGEIYDARLEKDGWTLPNYNYSTWNDVECLNISNKILIAQENVPVRVIQEITPTEILVTPKGETIIDFGQNMVGRVKFKAEGCKGTEIILHHGEVLDSEGNFYSKNLRKAKQEIKYIMKGIGIETYEPTFTFQGFRYVKIEGYPGEIKLENFCGRVIHSSMEVTGDFLCSNELVNKLHHNILWGQKGNFLDIPTDCPQRDERLGWTGDAQMFIRTACFNMNVASFFTKWVRDLASEQNLEKGVPFVIPNVLGNNSYSSSAWGDAATICPWTIYMCYGDVRLLEEQYESMKMWVEYIKKQGKNKYLWNTGFHFGDWLGLDSKADSYVGATEKDLIATAFYAYSTEIVLNTAKVLNVEEDINKYTNLYNKIVENFRREFITSTGRVVCNTQTAYVLILMFNLMRKNHKKRIVKNLVECLRENNYHLTTGFVGTPYICHVLSENGYNDIAYKLLMQQDYPSWLYQITKGATTIWEHWDGIKEDGSFWSSDMNSFNHYAYGAIGDWLYRVVVGINTSREKVGYKHIIINPQQGEGLDFAEASLETMYGKVMARWDKEDKKTKIKVIIPCNCTATVILSGCNVENVMESGKNLNVLEGILGYRQLDNNVEIEIGSGDYYFNY